MKKNYFNKNNQNTKTNNKKSNLNLNKINLNDILDSSFYTESSKDINKKLIDYANDSINRHELIIEFNKIFYNYNISENLEKGIYEFALVHVTINNLLHHFVVSIYKDKANDIINNLNGNSRINNLTLKQNILDGHLKPRLVAFLSPEQLHPTRWESLLKKQTRRIEAENNLATTDLYTCRKCGEKKFKLMEFQTRGADEPTTNFLTCMVCYTTFTKS